MCWGTIGHQVNQERNLKFRIHIVGDKQLQEPIYCLFWSPGIN